MAVNMDIIEKSGSWFSYDGNRIGQGRENVKKYLKENPEILADVEQKVRANFANPSVDSRSCDLQTKNIHISAKIQILWQSVFPLLRLLLPSWELPACRI